MDYIRSYGSPLGTITLASDGLALTGLWFEGQKYYGSTLTDAFTESVPGEQCAPGACAVFDEAAEWLDRYFSGIDPGRPPRISLRGTDFRCRVWNALAEIPYGQTVTYGEVAGRLGCGSARAVGNAAAHNPVSLMIPCHRVIAADGSLTGYAGGTERKEELLRLEGCF